MSLNVKKLMIGETEITLRLTTKAICGFVLKHGVNDAPPLVAVLSAVDNLNAKIDLLTGALQHPENANEIKSGDALLDLLADAGWRRDDVNSLILELAQEAGLADGESITKLDTAVRLNGEKTVDSLVSLLKGELSRTDAEETTPDAHDENPT